MDGTTGVVTYAQDYDLDATSMPQTHFCTVIAEDSAANNGAFYIFSVKNRTYSSALIFKFTLILRKNGSTQFQSYWFS